MIWKKAWTKSGSFSCRRFCRFPLISSQRKRLLHFEVQLGLPPYGPEALPFSATGLGTHSEGYVVKVVQSTGTEWTGNFQRGLSGFDAVMEHPNKQQIVVIAGGQAYVVDVDQPDQWYHFGGGIEYAHPLDERDAILIGNGLWFELHGRRGIIWKSRRISWDGMREVRIESGKLFGLAWTYEPPDTWEAFLLDLSDGSVTGGTYTGPD
ncbi:MAG: hypothetical protein ACPG4Q_07880 [Phycisphaeraceae bacterium]